MKESAQYRMADRLADGNLAEVLLRLRDEDRSPEDIGRQLYADYGIQVSRPTVSRWIAAAEATTTSGSAA